MGWVKFNKNMLVVLNLGITKYCHMDNRENTSGCSEATLLNARKLHDAHCLLRKINLMLYTPQITILSIQMIEEFFV